MSIIGGEHILDQNGRRGPHVLQTTLDQEFTVFIVNNDSDALKPVLRLARGAGYATRTFSSATDFLTEYECGIPGCLVLDLQMPKIDGHKLQTTLLREGIELPVIFASSKVDVPTIVEVIRAGAVDFITKPIKKRPLLKAIATAAQQDLRLRKRRIQVAAVNGRLARLTPREAEVLRHVIAGHLNKRIAGDLGVVEKTIKVHRSRVMEKMGTRSLVELVRMAEKVSLQPVTVETWR
jgi:FixJ family two-component response regulator